MDVFWQKGEGQKPPRAKPSRQKLRTKPPGQKPSWTKTHVCMHVLLKIWGVQEVWCTLGGSRDVWQSVTGGGSKLAQNSMMYFMDANAKHWRRCCSECPAGQGASRVYTGWVYLTNTPAPSLLLFDFLSCSICNTLDHLAPVINYQCQITDPDNHVLR